jgi:hypothetical protein
LEQWFALMKQALRRAGLAAYGMLARTGVMKPAWARRPFLVTYSVYKAWIEAGPVNRLKEFVAPGSRVVDIGANVGFFTLKFADWTGESGSVIAVEPIMKISRHAPQRLKLQAWSARPVGPGGSRHRARDHRLRAQRAVPARE